MRHVPLLLLAGLAVWAANPARPDPKGVGSPNAPITIEVFSDFQCPHCKLLHDQTLNQLIRDYVVPGKVYLIHREFPLPGHTYARQAAAFAVAAERMGRYEEVTDRLWLHQTTWSVDGSVAATACRGLAPAEAQRLRTLANDPSVAAEIQHDIQLGQQADLHQTPTLIVKRGSSSYPLAGAVNYDLLRSFLDSQLK